MRWSSPRSLHLSQFGLIFPEPAWLELNTAFQMRSYQRNIQPCQKSLIWYMLRTHLPIYRPHNTGGFYLLTDIQIFLLLCFQLISTLSVAKILNTFLVHDLVLSTITFLFLVLQSATFCSSQCMTCLSSFGLMRVWNVASAMNFISRLFSFFFLPITVMKVL